MQRISNSSNSGDRLRAGRREGDRTWIEEVFDANVIDRNHLAGGDAAGVEESVENDRQRDAGIERIGEGIVRSIGSLNRDDDVLIS